MRKAAIAFAAAFLALGALPDGSGLVAAAGGIDIVGPADSGRGIWSGDRMLGARERLKDILPGRFE
jgi:hypothetical protein